MPFSSHRVSATGENFVIKKTHCNFSAIPMDQAHEQSNKTVKGEGGFTGRAEDHSQLLRWMVLGPDIARAIEEFGQSQDLLDVCSENPADCHHHDQTKSVQQTFITQVKAFCQPMELTGNRLIFDKRDVMDNSMVEAYTVYPTEA